MADSKLQQENVGNKEECVMPGQYFHLVDDMRVLYPEPMEETLKKIANTELDSQDILIATYPKSGTMWTSDIINLILNDGDVNMLKMTTFPERIPCLEISTFAPLLEKVLLRQPPRLMFTHLFPQSLHRQIHKNKAKIVVVMRNPKDVLVSFYHFHRCLRRSVEFTGSWDDFFDLFKRKYLLFGDVFDYNLAWWKLRDLDHVFIMKYEDMKRDLRGAVQRLGQFLGRPLSDDLLDTIAEATTFKSTKAHSVNEPTMIDPSRGSFLRKGEVGDWVNYFTEEQSIYVDNIYNDRWVPEGLVFDFK